MKPNKIEFSHNSTDIKGSDGNDEVVETTPDRNVASQPARDPALVPMPQLDAAAGRELTSLQRTAEKTNGVVTPANAITMLGVGLTALGCHEFVVGNHSLAVGIIAVGAVCDALDGQVARRTRTANYQVGRYLDIGADGVKAAMLGGALYSSGVYSGVELAMNYGPKALGWLANGASKFIAKNDPKTSQAGRVAEVSRWVAPGLAVASSLLVDHGQSAVGEIVRRTSHVATVASCALGLTAAAGYVKGLVASHKQKESAALSVIDNAAEFNNGN